MKRLREYFQIQGGLRLPEMGNNYITEDGEFKYFPSEDNDLNLILDFVEYTLILALSMIILYVVFGIATSIVLPSTYFAIQKSIIQFKRLKV